MLQNFINKHFQVGEMYLEILQSPCVDTCEKCPKPKFIGLECHKIFKPIPGYSANGYSVTCLDQKSKIRILAWYSTFLWHGYNWKTFVAKIFESSLVFKNQAGITSQWTKSKIIWWICLGRADL